jgi:hypothetical protein
VLPFHHWDDDERAAVLKPLLQIKASGGLRVFRKARVQKRLRSI